MGYAGNLHCNGCGLTFTSRWGSVTGADEYRCENDHVVLVRPSGEVVAVEGAPAAGLTLLSLRGRCPLCGSELASGMLPACPVCGGRDHDVTLEGRFG